MHRSVALATSRFELGDVVDLIEGEFLPAVHGGIVVAMAPDTDGRSEFDRCIVKTEETVLGVFLARQLRRSDSSVAAQRKPGLILDAAGTEPMLAVLQRPDSLAFGS
jgi:hypothetical protein